MPPKRHAVAARYALASSSITSRKACCDFTKISTKETYSMTPPEKPRPAASTGLLAMFTSTLK